MGAEVKKVMKRTLGEIQNGNFADEWVKTYEKEGPRAFQKYLDDLEGQQVEQVGKRLRSMMWPNDQVT